MDPISVIISSLVAGVSAAMGDTAKKAVADAYQGLKALILRKYAGANLSVQQIEAKPASQQAQGSLREDLERDGAATDKELLQKATELARLIQQHAPDTAASVGVDINDLVAEGTVFLQRIDADKVNVQHVRAGKDFVLTDVRARKS
jgi:hypothetical protein